MRQGYVKLKKQGRADEPGPLAFHVPSNIVTQAGLEPGMVFHAEITSEGILYRPVDPEPMPDTRPDWRR